MTSAILWREHPAQERLELLATLMERELPTAVPALVKAARRGA